MKKIEYKVEHLQPTHSDKFENGVNKLAKDGWELVPIDLGWGNFLFKRDFANSLREEGCQCVCEICDKGQHCGNKKCGWIISGTSAPEQKD